MQREKQRLADIRRRLHQIELERARQDRELAEAMESAEIDVDALARLAMEAPSEDVGAPAPRASESTNEHRLMLLKG